MLTELSLFIQNLYANKKYKKTKKKNLFLLDQIVFESRSLLG